MSDVKHMNAEDEGPEVEWEKSVKPPVFEIEGVPLPVHHSDFVLDIKKLKEERRTQPPRTLLIVDEASGIDDDKVDVSAWAKRVIEITTPLQPFQTFAKPEFPPEAYSIENLLKLSKEMDSQFRGMDMTLRNALSQYFNGCPKRAMRFCMEIDITLDQLLQIMNNEERIPSWVYDRIEQWVKDKIQ